MKQTATFLMGFGIALLGASFLTGCGVCTTLIPIPGPQGPAGPTGPQGPTASSTPAESAVQSMVDTENTYRVSVGQEQLIPGLSCTLSSVPNTTTTILSATGLTTIGSFEYSGVFNQPVAPTTSGLNVLPVGLQGVYQTWYILKCTGDLVVSDNNWHEFDLSSDDGSLLYVDGLLVNNDGLHGTQTVSASKYLKYGIHSFQINYLQGAGQESLNLNEDGAVMSTSGFYH